MVLPDRVVFTDRALELLRQLRAQHGELIFHLSGGCCEGSAPMCFRAADFRVGQQDVLLGVIDGCPFYVAAAHFRYVASCQLCIDVVDGGGDSFSLEAVDGVRFIARSRRFDDTEAAALAATEPAPLCAAAYDPGGDLASTESDRKP
jgi:Uncharacterized protein conserved in bacteria